MSLGINIENDKEVFQNFINVQKFINEKKRSLSFFKTHSSLVKMYDCDFTNLENSLAVIYIVRDPRNVVTSFANHNGISVDEATEIIIDQNMFTDKSTNVCKVLSVFCGGVCSGLGEYLVRVLLHVSVVFVLASLLWRHFEVGYAETGWEIC